MMADSVNAFNGLGPSHLVKFSHPNVGSLSIDTGMDAIAWSYELNVETFPTYGGQVVQILGVYIGDLSVQGSVRTYSKMEQIYRFFAEYIQQASQGRSQNAERNTDSYNQQPVTFEYPHRGWQFKIMPLRAPGFRYSRDLVVPEWRLVAHVVDNTGDAQSLKDMVVQNIMGADASEVLALKGEIGFKANDPFSSPYPEFDPDKINESFSDLADVYNKLIPSYLEGDFSSLTEGLGARPAFGVTEQGEWPDWTDKADKMIEAEKREREGSTPVGVIPSRQLPRP